jgi:hypothetical protein
LVGVDFMQNDRLRRGRYWASGWAMLQMISANWPMRKTTIANGSKKNTPPRTVVFQMLIVLRMEKRFTTEGTEDTEEDGGKPLIDANIR